MALLFNLLPNSSCRDPERISSNLSRPRALRAPYRFLAFGADAGARYTPRPPGEPPHAARRKGPVTSAISSAIRFM